MATGKVDLSCESELNKLKKSDLVNLIKELNDQLKGEVILVIIPQIRKIRQKMIKFRKNLSKMVPATCKVT